MKIVFHKKFEKQFSHLRAFDQEVVLRTIERFKKDPYDPVLKNHALKGNLKTQRSISVRFDLRLIYVEANGMAEILFLRLGSHEAVY